MAYLRETRKIDSKSRISLPKEVLDTVGLSAGDEVTFEVTKASGIILRKAKKYGD